MTGPIVSQANTNLNPDSIVKVKIDEYICTLTLEKNKFGDTLPIIPTSARTERNKILYHLSIKAKITKKDTGNPVPDYKFSIRSNRTSDRLESKGKTNAQGESIFTLITREPGELELDNLASDITMPIFSIRIQEAWYESPFLITGYNVCDENDFSGKLVDAKGLDEKHKDDFLYGASGVAMQGTGKTIEGKYVRLHNNPGGWQKNSKGSPERLANPASAEFSYANAIHGKYDDLKETCSIAVDKKIIPKKAKLEIEGLGERVADDSGGAIDLYHIDNFLGSGKSVVTAWLKGGINGTKRHVKYIGVVK